MRRRDFLKLSAGLPVAGSAVGTALLTGCGGGDSGGTMVAEPLYEVTTRFLGYDQAGNAYEWLPEGNLVRALAANGTTRWEYSGGSADNGGLNWPTGLTVVGDRIYIADFGNSQIVVLNQNGQKLSTIGANGTGPGKFQFVQDVVARGDGRLYACDALNHRVQILDVDGRYLGSWGTFGTGALDLNCCEGIAFDRAGRAHVISSGNCAVVVFDTDGKALRSYGQSGTDALVNPEALVIDRADHVYVADKTAKMLYIFDPDGNLVRRFQPRFADGTPAVPLALSWRPDGSLLVVADVDPAAARLAA